jgi:4-diphosphocytidyl-2C-methyl-D-erythritol kinase
MTGSGPSVFGIFESKDQALSAERHLISRDLGNIFVVEGI